MLQRLRIGEPDVLDRHAHQTAREEQRVLAGREHAGEPVQRGVGIGAAHRFVQGRDQVVVPVAGAVVDGGAALHDVGEPGHVEGLVRTRGAPDLLGERQRRAAVAVGHREQRRARVIVERQSARFEVSARASRRSIAAASWR